MKNIHVLPTDKPSRYWMTRLGNLTRCHDIKPIKEALGNNVNIYITSSNADINENDYTITKDNRLVQVSYLMSKDLEGASKVILTTNKLLIKDGVQAIDDEFLEWFVKNPSCEEVKVVKTAPIRPFGSLYKIIIPKEEPKQETHICKYCNAETTQSDDECYAKPKTLEEVAERYAEGKSSSSVFQEAHKKDFIEGAKWQQERMYSEEEVLELLQKALTHQDDGETGSLVTAQGKIRPANFFSWFNKFKNK
jgi:hypothetical protein